jgi:hypothetical protein
LSGAWVDEYNIGNSGGTVYDTRMFSPSGNQFIISTGSMEFVHEWGLDYFGNSNIPFWQPKGSITTGAGNSQYSYNSDENANVLTVQEWDTFYHEDGSVSVWKWDTSLAGNGMSGNYIKLNPELTHDGASHSSALDSI